MVGLLSLGLGACGGDSGGPTGAGTPIGTYQLRSIDGKALPALMIEGTPTTSAAYITKGSITLKDDGTYSANFSVRAVLPGGAPYDYDDEPWEGTWTASGTTLNMTLENYSEPFTANWQGDALDVRFGDPLGAEGKVFNFSR